MTCAFDEDLSDIDPGPDIDLWAIRVVVREGRYVKLRHSEQVIAVQLMRRKGLDRQQMAERLQTNMRTIDRCMNAIPVLDVESLPDEMVGAPFPKYLLPMRSVVQQAKRKVS